MKRVFKITGLGLVVAIMGSLLIGCASKEPTEKEEKPVYIVKTTEKEPIKEQQQVVTIRTVSQFAATDPAAEVYEMKLKEFKDETPNITIEDESGIPDKIWKAKLATDFIANNEADVVFTFTNKDINGMIEQNKIVSIEEIRQEYPDYAQNIPQNILSLVAAFDGNTYAVPVRGSYQGLFINKEIFQRNNLDLPTDWEKFETAITSLNKRNITPIAAALGQMPNSWIDHLILSQGGADVHQNKDITLVKNQWIKGLEYLKTLYDLGGFPAYTNAVSSDVVLEMFLEGEAAMLLTDNKIISEFKELDNIIVLPFPVVPGGQKDPSDVISEFSTGWYITRKAWDQPAKQAAAVKFVEAMTTTEAISEFTTIDYAPAAYLDEVEGLPEIAISGYNMQASANNISMPISSWLSQPAWDYLVSKIPGIVTGENKAKTLVEQVIKINEEK